MKGMFAPLVYMIYSDGSIINAYVTDVKKKFYEYPNKASNVTDCPERAYYTKEMVAQRPLSEIDDVEKVCIDAKRE